MDVGSVASVVGAYCVARCHARVPEYEVDGDSDVYGAGAMCNKCLFNAIASSGSCCPMPTSALS